MDWKKLLAEADALFEKVKALLADPDATEEQKSHIPEMLADAQKKKADALQYAQADTGQAEMKALLRPDEQKQQQQEQEPVPAGDGGGASHPAQAGGEFKGWGDYLHSVWRAIAHGQEDKRLVWYSDSEVPSGHEEKQMVGNVGARGGFLIPVQFQPTLMAVQAEDSIVRPYASVIRMSRRQLALPVLDQTGTTAGIPHWFGGMRFYWADEAEEKTETEASFKRVNLVAKKLIGHTNASDELLDDSAISLGDFLSGPLGFAGGVSWMEDFAFLRGVGGGQPLGVVGAPCTLAPARAAAGAVSYVDCVAMMSRLLPSARARWVISQSVMSSLIQMTGPAGNPSYVWQPNAREGVPGYLFGLPVHWCEKMPRIGTRGDILLADFRYYIIGDRQRTTIDSSNAPRWIYDETTWRVVHRVDGQPWLSAPLMYQDGTTQVSPFVVLSGPTS